MCFVTVSADSDIKSQSLQLIIFREFVEMTKAISNLFLSRKLVSIVLMIFFLCMLSYSTLAKRLSHSAQYLLRLSKQRDISIKVALSIKLMWWLLSFISLNTRWNKSYLLSSPNDVYWCGSSVQHLNLQSYDIHHRLFPCRCLLCVVHDFSNKICFDIYNIWSFVIFFVLG